MERNIFLPGAYGADEYNAAYPLSYQGLGNFDFLIGILMGTADDYLVPRSLHSVMKPLGNFYK